MATITRKRRAKNSTGLPHGTFSRGDEHPSISGLFFHSYRVNYNNSELVYERWTTKEKLKSTRDRSRLVSRELYWKNREKRLKYWSAYNKTRRIKDNEYRKKQNLLCSLRHKRLRNGICYDHEVVEGIYDRAKTMSEMTGDKYQVDHYYPLKPRSKKYCGLHVPPNLRILSALENNRKNNIDPDVFYGEAAT